MTRSVRRTSPPDQFVAELYERMLARPGKPDEVAAWVEGSRDGMSSGDVAVRVRRVTGGGAAHGHRR